MVALGDIAEVIFGGIDGPVLIGFVLAGVQLNDQQFEEKLWWCHDDHSYLYFVGDDCI